MAVLISKSSAGIFSTTTSVEFVKGVGEILTEGASGIGFITVVVSGYMGMLSIFDNDHKPAHLDDWKTMFQDDLLVSHIIQTEESRESERQMLLCAELYRSKSLQHDS